MLSALTSMENQFLETFFLQNVINCPEINRSIEILQKVWYHPYSWQPKCISNEVLVFAALEKAHFKQIVQVQKNCNSFSANIKILIKLFNTDAMYSRSHMPNWKAKNLGQIFRNNPRTFGSLLNSKHGQTDQPIIDR